jgi:aryl-alcohol dehydrogenase-like predicted oxidoreductase
VTVLVIPGINTYDHLVNNIAAGILRVTSNVLARLEALHQATQ